ncbi:hypothetical protein [Planctomyces sp. SH-PL62]|uniref:hypothetical protein n=1 Tax=Planctomyces sp. SH-PL62 TaxID=1636152 RepID=UPI00078DB09B|nr:hypothetical protein [Planctomyces sp. SH-PL62]AMV40642.1 hypothetical protein VT85_24640 [Planctomyces sp. SH-PL62]
MRRVRPTVFRWILAIAVAAIVSHVATDRLKDRVRTRFEHCAQTADWHARVGAEYRRNAAGAGSMLRVAAWHDAMRRAFEHAAAHPKVAVPRSLPFPPSGWEPPAREALARRR